MDLLVGQVFLQAQLYNTGVTLSRVDPLGSWFRARLGKLEMINDGICPHV